MISFDWLQEVLTAYKGEDIGTTIAGVITTLTLMMGACFITWTVSLNIVKPLIEAAREQQKERAQGAAAIAAAIAESSSTMSKLTDAIHSHTIELASSLETLRSAVVGVQTNTMILLNRINTDRGQP